MFVIWCATTCIFFNDVSLHFLRFFLLCLVMRTNLRKSLKKKLWMNRSTSNSGIVIISSKYHKKQGISIFHKGIIWFCPSLGSWLHTVWMLWPVHRSVLRRIPSTIQMILWLHISRRLWTSDFGLFLYWVCTQTCLPDYHNYNCFFKLPERNLSQQKRQLTSFCLLDSGFTLWCSSDETFKNWLHGYGKYWFLLQHHQEI